VDVQSRIRVFEAIDSLPQDFKRIDILVNNAGLVLGMDPLETVSEEALDVMFNTNVKGMVNVTQACLPGMKTLDWSAIVNIGSGLGLTLDP
jgi:3-hydroxy acid dehydrogenase / malonic semialdehyde reductase